MTAALIGQVLRLFDLFPRRAPFVARVAVIPAAAKLTSRIYSVTGDLRWKRDLDRQPIKFGGNSQQLSLASLARHEGRDLSKAARLTAK